MRRTRQTLDEAAFFLRNVYEHSFGFLDNDGFRPGTNTEFLSCPGLLRREHYARWTREGASEFGNARNTNEGVS